MRHFKFHRDLFIFGKHILINFLSQYFHVGILIYIEFLICHLIFKRMDDSQTEAEPTEHPNEPSIPLPFPVFTIKRIAKQVLIIHKPNKQVYQRGISQKAGVIMSLATGIFLKHLSRDVLNASQDGFIKRKMIVNVLLQNPIYRFAMARMKSIELFDVFVDKNEISQKIASKHIEVELKFPIELIAPNPPEKHVYNEAKAFQRESENAEAVIKAAIIANQAYHQSVPSFFFHQKEAKK